MHWKDWCWSWSSNTLASWWEELTHWKRPWCWERLQAGGKGDDRGWDGWMASTTGWTWVWASVWELVMDREACPAAMHGVAKSQTWLSNWTELNWDTLCCVFPVCTHHCIISQGRADLEVSFWKMDVNWFPVTRFTLLIVLQLHEYWILMLYTLETNAMLYINYILSFKKLTSGLPEGRIWYEALGMW